MTVKEFNQAKFTIVNACNSTGLPPEDLVGVLSAILAEAREQMCFQLTGEVLYLEEELERLKKEVHDARNSDAEGPEA